MTEFSGGDDPVWARIDLEAVAGLLDGYTRWRDDPRYRRVHWRRVTTALDEVLQTWARDGVVHRQDLRRHLGPIVPTLNRIDAEGLGWLVLDPVQITQTQIINGAHRCAAIREQGVRYVPGAFLRADIGVGISTTQVYPLGH